MSHHLFIVFLDFNNFLKYKFYRITHILYIFLLLLIKFTGMDFRGRMLIKFLIKFIGRVLRVRREGIESSDQKGWWLCPLEIFFYTF